VTAKTETERSEGRKKKREEVGWAGGKMGRVKEKEVDGLREENHGSGEGFRLNSKGIVLFF
jgi:hypothetical protein